MKYKLSNQMGFTVLEISLASVVVFLVTGISLYTVNRVQNSQNDRAENTQQAPDDNKSELKTEEQQQKTEEVKVPAEQPSAVEKQPSSTTKKTETQTKTKNTEPEYKSLAVNITDAQVGADSVVFAANWEGSYQGTCYLAVKNLSTSSYVYKEVAVNGSSCSFSVVKGEMGTGSLKYYVTFKNSTHTVKGQSSYKTFNL